MITIRPAHAILCSALALAACSVPISAHAQDGAKYHWTFARKVGEVLRYHIEQSISGDLPDPAELKPDAGAAAGSPAPAKEFRYETSQTIKRMVKNVAGNGVATFAESTETRKRVIMGHIMPEDPSRFTTIEQEVGPDGLVVRHKEANEAAATSLSALGAMLNQFPTPSKAGVALQEKWRTPIANMLVKGKSVDFDSQLVKREKIGNADTLRVTFSMDIPSGDDAEGVATIFVKGSYNVDPKAGVIVRADYTVENFELPMEKGSIKATSHADITLVSMTEPPPMKNSHS